MNDFVPFDEVWPRVQKALEASALVSRRLSEQLWVVRDLMGRVRLLLPEQPEPAPELRQALHELAKSIHREVGRHAHEPERGVLSVEEQELEALKSGALRHEVGGMTVYLVDRLITGGEWATISSISPGSKPLRFALFSIKGGVGRSTTAAVLATHLAQQGHRVLVMDLDLESPGSSMLLSREEHPDFGIVDWFVEDLVGQGDEVVPRMIGRPSWGQDFRGEILVAPAYGYQPEGYLPKLGRVYLDRPPDGVGQRPKRWTERLSGLLKDIEEREKPDVVLLDSRNGLHDLAAAAVTDVQAHVLLFAVDSEATWTGYRILFQHWCSGRW